MITIDGKVYRTLPEQVEENAKDIASLEDAVEGKVYNPISSDTIVADKNDVAKTVAFTIAADVTAKINNSLQTPKTTPVNTILVGIDSTRSQCNVAVGDGLVIENDTLKATMTSDAVRAIVDEELGVIVNGRY